MFFFKFSGHNKIFGVQNKFGVALPPNGPRSYGPDVLPLNNSTSLVAAYETALRSVGSLLEGGDRKSQRYGNYLQEVEEDFSNF